VWKDDGRPKRAVFHLIFSKHTLVRFFYPLYLLFSNLEFENGKFKINTFREKFLSFNTHFFLGNIRFKPLKRLETQIFTLDLTGQVLTYGSLVHSYSSNRINRKSSARPGERASQPTNIAFSSVVVHRNLAISHAQYFRMDNLLLYCFHRKTGNPLL